MHEQLRTSRSHVAATTGRASRQWGVSLLELMVGLVVGLICVLIIVQLLTLWEGRKRSVTAGNDAQVSGTLGAFALDRDIRLGGFGFGTADAITMGCAVKAQNSAVSPPIGTFALAPVQIVKTDGEPDAIWVLYGNSSYFVASQPIVSATSETKELKSREGFRVGDKAVVANTAAPTNCQLIEVTGLSLTNPNSIEHTAGATYTTADGQNKAATMNISGGTGTDIVTGRIFNLGPTPTQTVWAVNKTRHTLTRYNRLAESSTAAQDVVSDVVTLQAQYGYDASGNGQLESTEWYDSLPAGADWTRVLALRAGLLMRSRQFERPNMETGTPVPVTTAAPRWGSGTKQFAMTNVDTTSDAGDSATALNGAQAANNWRNYRYRVYDMVVPLRNMIWGTSP